MWGLNPQMPRARLALQRLTSLTITPSRHPKKDAQLAYITTPDTAVHSVYGFYINYFSVQDYDTSRICSSDTCLFRPQWRHNPYKYFDFCTYLLFLILAK